MTDEMDVDEFSWKYHDELEYEYIKSRYSNRKDLHKEFEGKKKLLKNLEPTDSKFQRLAMSAELAQMRCDLAYVLDRNTQLEAMLSTVAFLHQRLDILEGTYGYLKLLVESSRIDYVKMAKVKLQTEELKDAIKQRDNKTDGPKG